MALRLAQSVLRGEIDNRRRGHVTGRIWLLGRDEPIELSLSGNAGPDLAGRALHFTNPSPAPGDVIDLAPHQEGAAGDLTAARKTRVLDMSLEEIRASGLRRDDIPSHMANTLYLEWFSNQNGRVVLEATGFELTVSEPAWCMTDHEKAEQQAAVRDAMTRWMEQLDRAREASGPESYDPQADRSPDEFRWEQMLKESDARTDRMGALMEEYRHHPDRDRLVARAMGWTWLDDAMDAEERGLFDDARGQAEELPEPEPNPLTEGIDWIRTGYGIRHPLCHRASEAAMAMWHDCKGRGLVGGDGPWDEDVDEMVSAAQTLGAKLAGALNHLGYDVSSEPGLIIASLKRALEWLNDSLAASERVERRGVLSASELADFRAELFDIREFMLALMDRFRNTIQ